MICSCKLMLTVCKTLDFAGHDPVLVLWLGQAAMKSLVE